MESAEHIWIGDQVKLQRAGGVTPAEDLSILTVADARFSNALRYGHIIALAGDFYGIVGGQISMAKPPLREAAFRRAWDTLAHGDPGQLHEILEIMGAELEAIIKVVTANKVPGATWREPSTVYAELGDHLSHRWNGATGGSYAEWWPTGRYLRLAAENFDHFGTMARDAYAAGHRVAMKEAAEARNLTGKAAEAKLDNAYAMNAFADHFLTDLFSAGHLRVPRKQLYDCLSDLGDLGLAFSGPLVRAMHDEDSWNGLHVTNARGDDWVAFGDRRLLDSASEANRKLVKDAVQASADDVWKVYQGLRPSSSAFDFIPNIEKLLTENADQHRNGAAVFTFEGRHVMRRADLGNMSDYRSVVFTNPIDTSLWFGTRDNPADHTQYVHARCFTVKDQAFVGWLWSDEKGNARLAHNEADAHGVVWWEKDGVLSLQKDTKGGERYLGLGDRNYASWGRPGGNYWCPVLYNEDLTISLKSDPTRKLFLDNDDWLSWTAAGTDNPNILKVDVPPPGGPYC